MELATGSRRRLGATSATTTRLLAGAFFLVAFVGLLGAFASEAWAGAVDKLTVNSTANTDDGDCEGPPNDTSTGDCTLHEAIDQVNSGLARTINFHPAVFTHAAPGIIELELGQGELPPILREVEISAKDRGVILDGDFDDDGLGVPWGILVLATHNGFDFTLNGGGDTLIIRDVGIDLGTRGEPGEGILGPKVGLQPVGVILSGFPDICETIVGGSVQGTFDLCCPEIDSVQGGGDKQVCPQSILGRGTSGPPGPFSLGDVLIDGVKLQNIHGIGILAEAANLNNFVIRESEIEADRDGVRLLALAPDKLTNNNVEIIRNRIIGGESVVFAGDGDQHLSGVVAASGHGVFVDFCCDVGSKLSTDVSFNELITGNAGDGVTLGFCMTGGCEADSGTEFNFEVNGNAQINGLNDAVAIDVLPDSSDNDNPLDPEGSFLNVDIDVIFNGILDAEFDDGIDIAVDVCCVNSDSVSNINIDDNDDIVGDDNAVDIDATVCCADDNESHVSVSHNRLLLGEGDEGVDIETHAGSPDTDVDSDENIVTVEVIDNDDIIGDNGEGLEIEASTGKLDDAGDADRNRTEVTVSENDDIDGDDDAVEIDARAGTAGGPGDADDNVVIVNVIGNDDIDGADDEGFDIDVAAGTTAGFGMQAPNTTGDGNSTQVIVEGNDDIQGHGGEGILVQSFAGGDEPTGERNSTSVEIINNDGIIGGGSAGDGIETDSFVCCDAENTNTVVISENGDDILGQDADGIDIDNLCCSINTVTISDNEGVIRGHDDNGIEITPCLINHGDPHSPQDVVLADVECMAESITFLTITGNEIFNSGNDGIIVCCGAFQFPVVQGPLEVAGVSLKSLIADNEISHNGEDGIDLDTTVGINIERNDVFENGTNVSDGDNGIEIDWQFGYNIWNNPNDVPDETFKIPAHYNRISENSTYDNKGLGINLIGIYQTIGEVPGSGEEAEAFANTIADGVGCDPFTDTPIVANDCLPYPKILFTGPGDKVTGGTCGQCTVEIFLADDTVRDQTGPLGRQHGEGREFLVAVEADGLGDFSVELPCGLDEGMLTATATDKLKNTSEFASNIPFPGSRLCATATPGPTNTPTPAPATNTPTPGPATSTPLPAPPTATATAVPPAKMCGDVNDDGLVNAVDAQLILQLKAALVDALPNEPSGDVNSDGQLTAVDASLILQKTAGLISQDDLHCP